MVRLFLLHAVYKLKCWELISNNKGDDNESAKKAIGQGSVYMEVGDPS